VLAGVHQALTNCGMRRQSAEHGSGFHKIRPGSNHVKNVHRLSSRDRMHATEFA
jgi:hypothetical protein